MLAVRCHRGRAGVSLDTVPLPAPGLGEVAVRVEAAGLCGTDVSIVGSADSPLVSGSDVTLGHEGAGTVAALAKASMGGPSATAW
jgi:propanol-preferring alcohol dehydrogenase